MMATRERAEGVLERDGEDDEPMPPSSRDKEAPARPPDSPPTRPPAGQPAGIDYFDILPFMYFRCWPQSYD